MVNQEREQNREQQQQQQARQQAEATPQGKCPNCGFENDEGAAFCAECGAGLHTGTQCPRCGTPAHPGGDLCQACGLWLLPGKCTYCYAPIAAGDAFCAQCGNPAAGLACRNCGTSSFFDFCPTCNTPLTEQAQESLALAASNPELAQAKELLAEIARAEEEIKAAEAVNLQQLEQEAKEEEEREKKRAMVRNVENAIKNWSPDTPAPTKPAPAAPKPATQNMREALLKAQAAARKKNEIEQKKRAAAEQLHKSASLTFPDPQNARRFFNATKPAYPCAWKCNAFSVIHKGPHECSRPDMGGEWVMDLMHE